MAKIALNILKVGMHSYFSNAELNLWLNFNFEKLVKRESSLCGFAKVGLKGGEDILECLIRWNLGSKMGLIRKRAKISICELEFKNQ